MLLLSMLYLWLRLLVRKFKTYKALIVNAITQALLNSVMLSMSNSMHGTHENII